ncbi:hypothetical protein [Endozoicomonas ascidiicola]|uniref:hypothetical protein n=1 Tax=Endozoicomonas ascidiicola TaxID=1698521 RepID=UPI00082BC5B9|nr:hypothetical protein [Endozoicomonas ascidiicola]
MNDPDPSGNGSIIEQSSEQKPALKPSVYNDSNHDDEKKILAELKDILKSCHGILDSSSATLKESVQSSNHTFRTKIRNLLPLSLYKLFSRLKPIHDQKKLGSMIALFEEKNQAAWQKLGEARAEGVGEKSLRSLQLECEQTQLWLDLLEGRGASQVTADRSQVVENLKACVLAETDNEFQQADVAFHQAVHEMKISTAHETDLKGELQAMKAACDDELKEFEKMLIDEASALEAYRRYGQKTHQRE